MQIWIVLTDTDSGLIKQLEDAHLTEREDLTIRTFWRINNYQDAWEAGERPDYMLATGRSLNHRHQDTGHFLQPLLDARREGIRFALLRVARVQEIAGDVNQHYLHLAGLQPA